MKFDKFALFERSLHLAEHYRVLSDKHLDAALLWSISSVFDYINKEFGNLTIEVSKIVQIGDSFLLLREGKEVFVKTVVLDSDTSYMRKELLRDTIHRERQEAILRKKEERDFRGL